MRDLSYKLRNSVLLGNIISWSIGGGMSIVGFFAPYYVDLDISREIARGLVYGGFGLIAFGAGLAIWKLKTNPIEKTERIYSIISIISQMKERLMRLEGKIEINERKHPQIFLNELPKFLKTTNKIIELVGLERPTATTIDDAKLELNKTEQIVDKYFRRKTSKTNRMRTLILPVNHLLDRDGFGLKRQRQSDKKYLKLKRDVDIYFDEHKDMIDEGLKELIQLNIDFVEASVNAVLTTYRIKAIFELAESLIDIDMDALLSPSLQAQLEGFEDDIKRVLRDMQVDIGTYIRLLKSKLANKKQ